MNRSICFGWLILTGGIAWGGDFSPAEIAHFEKEIRPLLVERCQKCHGPEKQSGGLRLDQRGSALAGGESGPAIVPGDLDASLLVSAIRRESFEMPPDGKLPDGEVAKLVEWVRRGAPWPGDVSAGAPPRSEKITDEDRRWWAFQPVGEPQVPQVDDRGWSRGDLDRFIFQRLASAGLEPAEDAPPGRILRRLYFDLVGLPPTPAEIAQFVAAYERGTSAERETLYAQTVDRLLESPHYGERWARHWLDLVRYADSDGYRIDDYRPHAWRYRDYVVRSLNADKPYDRFVQEQLAGDELFPGDLDALTATGYLRHWIYEYNNRDVRTHWSVILNDITDTTSDVFLGVGLQCARCHDHKFDPLLQRDYFRLQAFFSGVLPREDLVAATPDEHRQHAEQRRRWEEATASIRAELEPIEERLRQKTRTAAIDKFPPDIQAMILKPAEQREPQEHQLAELAYRQVYYEWDRLDRNLKGEEKEQVLALRKSLAQFDALRPEPLPPLHAMTDLGPRAAPVLIPKKGPTPIEPGFLTILDERPAHIDALPHSTGRRSALARWLTQPDNPLSTRVIVNRIWQYHFGQGLASNASDFGKLGEAPTHPELLDWLTRRFLDDGWSWKQLHRRIVLSSTYRQGARVPADALRRGLARDPENRLYWHAATRRLDAEQIRDALFAVSGELDLRVGGAGEPGESSRRSLYLRVMRNARNPLLEVFDAPQWIQSASSRDTTTTPVQSLLMINSPLLLERAHQLSDRLRKLAPDDERQRIDLLYRLLMGRPASDEEQSDARDFLLAQRQRIDAREAGSAQAAFQGAKLPYRDGQAALISSEQRPLVVPHHPDFPQGDFTIETFFELRSVYDSGAVRVLVSQWAGNLQNPGWSFGVTGKQSRRKPQTLVMQMVGRDGADRLVEAAVFSDQHIELNKPYYAAASVRLAGAEPGLVTFYLKDLSNDDEPLLSASVSHVIRGGYGNNRPLILGGRDAAFDSRFDGLIDDVRLSSQALGVSGLLFTSEGTRDSTIGYWRFEPQPDVFADASTRRCDITSSTRPVSGGRGTPEAQAWIDLCHVLLNSNEFLYVE